LSLQVPHFCQILLKFRPGHVSPTTEAKITIRFANLWFVVDGRGGCVTLPLSSRPVIACEDGEALDLVRVGKRGVSGTQMQSHKNSELSSRGTST